MQTTPLVLTIKVLDNFYQPSDSLGGRYCMWWFFDTEFVHSIYFRDFIFLSVNFTHPVPKFIYPKYYKNSNKSCTFLFLGRLSRQRSIGNFYSLVRKSQNQFFLKLHCPKGQNFVKYFVRFLANGVSTKNAFEIY